MIKRVYVDNYKCLVNLSAPPGVVPATRAERGWKDLGARNHIRLRRLLSGDARVSDTDVFPSGTLTRWQNRNLQVFEIQVVLGSGPFSYRLEVEHEKPGAWRIHLEQLEVDGAPLFKCVQSEVQLYRDDHSEGPAYTADWRESALARVAERHDNTRLTQFLNFMRKVLVCSLHPPGFLTESHDENPLLSRDAHNFADWFRHALQERPDRIPEFTKTLAEVIAGFSGIRLERVGRETRALMVGFENPVDPDLKKKPEFRFDEISDGQRALVVWYGLIHLARDQGYSLFLDEPDNYVALREIQPWLVSLDDACGDTVSQAVVSSHHPELIDYLGYESGVLLQRETSGVITARPPGGNVGRRYVEGIRAKAVRVDRQKVGSGEPECPVRAVMRRPTAGGFLAPVP